MPAEIKAEIKPDVLHAYLRCVSLPFKRFKHIIASFSIAPTEYRIKSDHAKSAPRHARASMFCGSI
jgi:hypothetical protein